MNKRVLLVGDRLYMKFSDLRYFTERLSEAGYEALSTHGMDDSEIRAMAEGASAIVAIAYPVTGELLDCMKRCEFVMTLSVGYDCVDVSEATARGIPVSNSPTYCSDDVANHAMTLLVSLSRKLHLTTPGVMAGRWDYSYTKPIYRFQDRTLGVFGLGKIGRRIVPKAKGFGMRVIAYDPYIADDVFALCGVERKYEFDELLEGSDFISIHAPLTGETRHIFDREAFQKMRSNAVIINTARGPIVDQKALLEALETGRIASAGLDVLDNEPPDPEDPILSCKSVLVTPHIAWYSEESFEENKTLGMDELIRVLDGKRPRYVVNPDIYGA